MRSQLTFSADWELLSEGAAEERACFSALGIQWGDTWLTEGQDGLANRLRQKPLLSAYHFAMWLAANWWRLRWEPRANSVSWRFAHRTANIGGGYAWPDITIFSDGERTALVPRVVCDEKNSQAVFRYLNTVAAVVPSNDFEIAVDDFLNQVIERLKTMSIEGSELEQLWGQVREERGNSEYARTRKLEALLGRDPDEVGTEVLEQLIADQHRLGTAAVEELAADFGYSESKLQSINTLSDMQKEFGFSASSRDLPKLPEDWILEHKRFENRAWNLGALAAKAVRDQIKNTEAPIDDDMLCQMAAVNRAALDPCARANLPISFALNEDQGRSRVVLRGKRQEGRRFELGRILGDRLLNSEEALNPATRAYTYRQKAQRAFSAELLSPFHAVFNLLQGDYSSENQMDVAEYFNVSQWTIATQLMNNRVIDRVDLEYQANAA